MSQQFGLNKTFDDVYSKVLSSYKTMVKLNFLNGCNDIKHNPSIFTKKQTFRITAERCLESLDLVRGPLFIGIF